MGIGQKKLPRHAGKGIDELGRGAVVGDSEP